MTQAGILYVVATPIGNLADISLRALDTLNKVDAIAAEDTRHSAHLLKHYKINKKMIAVHAHNEQQSALALLARLQSGESIALITDAGTPAISDPGAFVVSTARGAGITVTAIPGANAAITALSASGIAKPRFMFIGFLPTQSSQRCKQLEVLKTIDTTLIFYEAPHRIIETIQDLNGVLGCMRNITFARELTKTYETLYTCPLGEAEAWLMADSNQQKGEFVLLVEYDAEYNTQLQLAQAITTLKKLLVALPLKQAVALATDITGHKKNQLYEIALTLKNEQSNPK